MEELHSVDMKKWFGLFLVFVASLQADESFYFYGEGLWLHAYSEGAVIGEERSDRSKVVSHPEKWYWGHRLGCGYENRCAPCFETTFEWTHIQPKTCAVMVADEELEVTPFSNFSLFEELAEPADKVKGRWQLKWTTFDLSIGRSICLSECVHFRPHVDLRMAHIRDKHRITTTASYKHVETHRHEFCGLGPRVGFETEWQIGCCWGFYGNIAASLLYGDLKERSRVELDLDIDEELSEFDLFDGRSRKRHGARPLTDLAAGIFWRQDAYSTYSMTVRLGWEHHYLFYPERLSNHDFSLQGGTVYLGFDF